MIINDIEKMSIEDINEAICLLEKERIRKHREEYVNVMEKIRDVISKIPSDYKSRSIVIGDEIFDWYDLEEAIIGLIRDAR